MIHFRQKEEEQHEYTELKMNYEYLRWIIQFGKEKKRKKRNNKIKWIKMKRLMSILKISDRKN